MPKVYITGYKNKDIVTEVKKIIEQEYKPSDRFITLKTLEYPIRKNPGTFKILGGLKTQRQRRRILSYVCLDDLGMDRVSAGHGSTRNVVFLRKTEE